jgi:hypothetical protein
MNANDDVRYNHLKDEKSPYLIQHATNLVDWYPWGDTAFEKAKEEDKPIFLSIGYSTCHWCHVMEHESFEDEEVARLMNETFVNIKVDREERPDIDSVYMTTCQLVTGRGGWPLTIIMTPEKKPFFASTYIPDKTRHQQIGMVELIPRIKELWETQREKVYKSAEDITSALKNITPQPTGKELSSDILDKTYQSLLSNYDEEYGGFGSAPKFPSSHNLIYLLRYSYYAKYEKALQIVSDTLTGMRQGGIYDHLGYGFHRYATDREWLLPHFEKMLYDQAMLSLSYTEAYQATGDGKFKATTEEILEYVLRDMTSPEGGFYSAEDADTEGVEGKFYIWTLDEIKDILTEKETELAVRVLNLQKEGNFYEEATREKTGANILHLKESIPEIAEEIGMKEDELNSQIASIREKLFEAREERTKPHLDDKILTDWNGLMIATFAKAGRVFDDELYVDAGERCAQFILTEMKKEDGGLLHRYREGDAGIEGNLDDYAFFVWGLLELYRTTFDIQYLSEAISLTDYMIEHFKDSENGGFYFTSDEGEELLYREKDAYDGAIPSGNSIAILNLLTLSRITGNAEYDKFARETQKAFSELINTTPAGFTMLLTGVLMSFSKTSEVIIVGDPTSDETKEMIDTLNDEYLPGMVVLLKSTGEEGDDVVSTVEYLADYEMIDGKTTAYVCSGSTCKEPTTDVAELKKMLGN